MSKQENEKNRLNDEFEQIQREVSEFDVSLHLATTEDFPDLGTIELYDYDSDLTVATENSMNVLESLVELYLGDVPNLKEHPYIQNKMREDASVYAESIFLAKMTRRNLLNQLKQIDNGENSSRMHEVINQTLAQVRENSKFFSTQRSDLEKFYKNLRKDLGLSEIETASATNNDKISEEKASSDGSKITDNRDLNEMIKQAMLLKEEKKGKK